MDPAQNNPAPASLPREKNTNVKIIVILGAAAGLLTALLMALILSGKAGTGGQNVSLPFVKPPEGRSEPAVPESGAGAKVLPAPKINFASYENTASAPAMPAKTAVYKLKTNFSSGEVSALAQKLGLTQVKTSGDEAIAYNLDDAQNRGWLRFNLSSGAFTFRSYGEHKAGGRTANETAKAWLSQLGFADETISCPISYQKTNLPQVTFVECRRSWELTGIPILNLLGLLNLSETTALSQLRIGQVDEAAAEDAAVINVSTGENGRKRPDDFNTATVAVSAQGAVLMASSNLRRIVLTQALQPASDLLSPRQAWEQFAENKAQLAFVKPAATDWERAFPNNEFTADKAVVTDYLLAYLENLQAQEYLAPYYIVRGFAQNSESYRASFVQAVPASKIGLSAFTKNENVAGVSTQLAQADDSSSLKLSMFTPVPTATSVPGSGSGRSGACVPSEAQLNPLYDLPGYGKVGPFTVNSSGIRRAGNYFLIPAQTSPLPDINNVIAAFDQFAAAQNLPVDKSTQIRQLDDLQKEWQQFDFCPLRLTGSSPTLFVYGREGQKAEIAVRRDLTFADPGYNGKSRWEAEVVKDGQMLINGKERAYIYYEYEPVVFDRPQTGWMIKKTDLAALVKQTIAPSLKLNFQEEERLLFELRAATYGISAPSLFVGLISQQELDQKLPLSVSPAPSPISRYHFAVRAAREGEQKTAPQLLPLKRAPFMLLEFGAVRQ